MYRMSLIASFFCFILFASQAASLVYGQVSNTFKERSNGGQMRNFVFDSHTNSLYVGAVNTLYWLSGELRLMNSLELGPLDDHVNCSVNLREVCSYARSSMPAVNQALVIDTDRRSLIVCSTLYHGSCRTVDMRSFVPHTYFYKPVVSNDPNGSAVMFLGPGIETGSVLYVATSYSSIGLPAYRDSVAMISARNLSSLDLSWKSSTASGSISLLPRFRATFPMSFVGGFQHRNFVYFFVNHPNSLSSPNAKSSFIMRICKKDLKFQSFIEIPLECKVAGTTYGYVKDITLSALGRQLTDSLKVTQDAVFGVFTLDSNGARKESAVCVYSMDEIERKFQGTIQACYNGNYYTGPIFITEPTLCVPKNMQVPMEYCGEQGANHPLSGSSPIQPICTASVRDAVASSILAKTAETETVVFVGIQSGTILKLKLKSRENLSPVYGIVQLKQDVLQPVKDLIFGLSNNIFALTDAAIFSIKTYDCGIANSCSKCIQDPHCGWCVTSKRCCSKAVCNSTSLWLTEVCPLIVGLSQSQISNDKYRSTKLAVTVNFLPGSFRTVECRMAELAVGSSELSKAILGPTNVVTCQPFSHVPNVPSNRTHIVRSLSVLVDQVPWVTTSINVYNCSHLSDCESCTSTTFSCKWCAGRHRCLATFDECISIPGIPTNIDQSQKCPRIEFPPDKGSALIASGTRKSFTIVGINILKIYQDKLKCLFRIGSQFTRVRASFKSTEPVALKTIITCDPVELNYAGAQPFVSVPFDVVWESDLPLDKPDDLHVYLYKCRHLVSSCGHCLTMDAEYKCGWCGDHCSLEKDCTKDWKNRNYVCPNPKITSFSPSGGPVRGGTKLTIRGINLGVASSELEVVVAGYRCPIIANTYVPSESFTCVTGPVGSSLSGPTTVKIKSQWTASSQAHFHYKDPTLSGLSPRRGPCSGGTLLRVNGTNLDYGSSVSIALNQKPVQILSRNATQIEFLTPLQLLPMSVAVKAKIDGGNEIVTKDHFIYLEDPVVNSVDPRISLVSGGNQIDIRGSNLNSVLKPLLIVYIGHENRTAPCKVSGPSFLQCMTPDLRDVDSVIDQEVHLGFGLIMDNVTQLLNIPHFKNTIKPFTYFPLPSIRHFLSPIRYKKGEMVNIQGKNLGNLNQFRDLNITVGGVKCVLVDGSSLQLTFRPPDSPALNSQGLALVTIHIGNFNVDVGYISYKAFPLRLVLGIVLGIGLTLVVSVVLLVVCISRKRKRLAIYKKTTTPRLQDLEDKHKRAQCNSYSENNPCGLEALPLKSSQVESKDFDDDDVFHDDLNLKGSELYFQGLLKRIDNAALQKAAKEVFISCERIELGNLLGKGHFGQVFAATLYDEEMGNPVHVAVKTVEDTGLTPKVVESFLKEGVIMKKFDHSHVLNLLGISLGVKKEPMVILPFMANGDLRSYVKDKSREFTARQLLALAQQVAEGMAYLSSLNFIHRDLAARNCMIDDKNQVKVADFGLSHELYDREYYSSKDRKAKLPIKWMSLESLEDFIFTTKSDVWSFGVLMWELMTRGVTPYPDVDIFETRNYLASGRRLRKPKYCPDNIYDIMLDCWNKIPERRPTFGGLVNRIEVLLNPSQLSQRQLEMANDFGANSEPMYSNITAQQEAEGDYLKPTLLSSDYA